MFNHYTRAKLLGRPLRGGYEGEGTGGGWGDWGGGGGDTVADSIIAPEPPAAIAPVSGTSLTGGNLNTGSTGWGFAPGPVEQADAQAWADGLAGGAGTPADSVVVVPAKPTRTTGTPSVINKVFDIIIAGLGIASGNPVAVANGIRTGINMAQDSFSGSPAPSIFGGQETPAAAVAGAQFAGSAESGMGDAAGTMGAPVMGFGGVVVGVPQTPSGGTVAAPAGSLAQALQNILSGRPNTSRYAPAVGGQTQAAPAIAPALAVAGLAGLIFLG